GNNSVILRDVPRYYTALTEKDPRANVPTTPYDELFFLEGNWPSGGLISTVGDLLKYGQLLIDTIKGRSGQQVVPQAILKQMWTPQAPPMDSQYFIHSDYCM